jgi:hypothetical protein
MNSKTCDCTKIPFREDCIKHCTESVLRKANPNEKQTILGFDATLTQAIYIAYNTRHINSFEDLESALTGEQIGIIISTFRTLTQAQLDYFNKK